ncbi:hypothetical protein DMENIID0001_045290 [Sergentomyia squamirostris]
MSSVQNKMSSFEGKVPLKRSTSFQRLKCSAVLNFQIAGSKLKNEAVRTLVQNLINYSREVLLKTVTTLPSQAFKFICAVVVWILVTFVKHINIYVSTDVLVNWLLPQCERKTDDGDESVAVQPPHQFQKNHQQETEYVDAKLDLFLPPHTLPPTNAEPRGKTRSKTCRRTPLYVKSLIYGGAALACLELLTLILLLKSSHIPLGVLFQLSCITLIGCLLLLIATKTSPLNLRSKTLAKIQSQHQQWRHEGEKNHQHHMRISRARMKPSCYLNFTDKSLSKIKLL